MRNIIIFFAIVLQCHYLFAQKISEEQIPLVVKQHFSEKFTEAKPRWEKNDDGNFQAAFRQNKKKMNAVFNVEGKCMEIRTEITFKELPDEIITYIFEHYKGYDLETLEKIERGLVVTYHVELENNKLHKIVDDQFDYKGSLIEEVIKDEK